MSEVIFNDKGIPMMAFGKSYFAVTKGTPASKPDKVIEELDDNLSVGEFQIASWGDGNNFPNTANEIIGKTGVLNTGLKFLAKVIMGQGIFPTKVKGYDDNGNEQLEVINDPKLTRFLRSRMVRRYLYNSRRDILKFGSAFPELIPSNGGEIVGINTINAKHCRLTEANRNAQIEYCLVSGDWPDTVSEISKPLNIPYLDPYDPLADLERRKLLGTISKSKYIYPLRDEWSNDDYYPKPDWWTAKLAGWVDIANKVPTFLLKAYENQISWQWHVKIPYAYWDKKYPETEYKSIKERMDAIQDEMDSIEKNLTGAENANKAIFSMFEISPQGRAEEKWEIEPLDNKYKEGDKLFTSAAANSEILFTLMINPNVLGAGMPGGTYAGNQGGSNIREAFLVNVALAWWERQNDLDPIETMLEFNGVKDIELRFRNTILTTLDSGSGTQKTLS